MRRDPFLLAAVAGLVMVSAAGLLLGVPATGLVLSLVTVVCSAAIVQGYHRRRDQYFRDHQPEVTVRRKHMHGQDTIPTL